MEMEVRKIVVIVEEAEIARTALRWALHNLVRYGDLIILLHVYPITTGRTATKSRSKKKLRLLRLQGFQLALSFQHVCITNFPNTKTEIIVMEGDQDGKKISELVTQIGASTLVVGLHDQSFLYSVPDVHVGPPKIPYQICPDPSAIIWRSRRRRR